MTREPRVSPSTQIVGKGKLEIGDWVTIEDHVLVDLSDDANSVLELGDRAKLKWGSVLRTYGGRITIGARVSLGEYCIVAAHGGVRIGDRTVVGSHSTFTASEHIFSGESAIRFQGETHRGIEIGTDCWIGTGVHVLDGVSIGRHSVVGAGSVVTKSLPEFSVCVGTPCRVIRTIDHYGEETSKALS